MTTLPQTSPIRLPRPAAPGVVIPGAPAALVGAPPAIATGASQLTPADAWRVIRGNIWLLLTAIVLAAAAGYAINYYLDKYHARYTATGYIEVRSNANNNPLKQAAPQSDAAMAIDQRTQASMLKSEALISKVLQNPNSPVRSTTWFQQFGVTEIPKAKKDLQDRFGVAAIPESRLIAVSMSYSIPKDCRTIVEEVVDQHLRDQAQNNENRLLDKSRMLNNMKASYETERRNLAQELAERSVKLSSEGTMASGRISVKELELSNLVNEQFEKQSQLTTAQAMYNSLAQQANTPGLSEPALVTEIVDRDPQILSDKATQSQLDMAISDAATRLGPDHPSYKTLVARRASLEDRLTKLRAELVVKTKAQVTERLRNQASEAQAALDAITKRVETMKGEIGALQSNLVAYQTLSDRIKALDETLERVNNELNDITAVGTVEGGSVHWGIKPTTPDTPTFPKLAATMSVSVILGLGLALGIAFLRELLDTTIRSPRDITRVGQLNLLGMVPDENDDPQAAGARLPLVIFDAPHSMTAERLREVRTRLQHAASLDTTRSVMVTSPSPGDGKTTIAANLAAGLALIGRRILLVDANFRRPELHKVFGADNAAGFSTVLSNPDSFAATVRETQIPNLSVLTTGPKPANTTEMLESQLLADFIERALAEYDHVVFDSAPLLYSSETVAMAPKVDGVVTVVRARSNTRGVLQRLRDNLRQTKAENLGVVLNAVQAYGGGYYGRSIKTYYEYSSGNVA